MALPETDPESRILSLVDGAERRFLSAVVKAVVAAKAELSLDLLVQFLSAGTTDAEIDRISSIIANAISREYASSFFFAGNDTSDLIEAAVQEAVEFNAVAGSAVNTLDRERSRIRLTIFEGQQEATTAAITNSMGRNQSQRQTAEAIVNSVGLTKRQQNAIDNYRRLLEEGSKEALQRDLRDHRFDPTVRRAKDDPLSQAQIDRMVDRYSQRQLRARQKTIARSEAQQSVNAANEEAYQQAIESGALAPEQIKRKWNSQGDDRVRDSHQHLNGMVRGMDETFPGRDGDLRFPGDPLAPASETVNCRCVLETKIKPL